MTALFGQFLPLSLVLITFSLGLGLTPADFRRVIEAPRGFLVGALAQVVLLPLTALGLVLALGLEGEIALGIMVLSVCPGGVTSNLLTRLAGGSVALSITLTGVISVVSILTAPLLVGLWMRLFLDAGTPPIEIGRLVGAMFAMTGVPITAGMILRALAPMAAVHLERGTLLLGTTVFAGVLAATAAGNHALLASGLAQAGAALLVLAAAMVVVGWALATVMVPDRGERVAVVIETAVQNGPVGVTIGGLIEAGGGLSQVALPSGLYAVAMYAVAAPVVLVSRMSPGR